MSAPPALAGSRRVRLVDVARAAGVSKASASLALRGDGRPVAPATVQRVRAVALRLGYVPDLAAQALAGGLRGVRRAVHYGTVAVLAQGPDSRRALQGHLARDAKRRNIAASAEELGYTLEGFELPTNRASIATLVRTLRARGVRGLLVDFQNNAYEAPFPWEEFAVVALSRHPVTVELNSVTSHGPSDVVQAVRRCRALGYRRLGLVINPVWYPDWHAGYELGVRRYGGGFDGAVHTHDLWDEEAFLRWFERHRPDVVLANENILPISALTRIGLSVPQDVGYCALDVEDGWERLSGLVQHKSRASALAFGLLHDLLRAGEQSALAVSGPVMIEVAAGWTAGTTLRPVAAGPPSRDS